MVFFWFFRHLSLSSFVENHKRPLKGVTAWSDFLEGGNSEDLGALGERSLDPGDSPGEL